jgi:ubiquinone/menaquinone biosynthesis C-methylase UbiE
MRSPGQRRFGDGGKDEGATVSYGACGRRTGEGPPSGLYARTQLGLINPMSFAVAGDKYDRFMGRYSRELAPLLIEFAGVDPGMVVVDVGCGPGPLTERLVQRVGAGNVAAADPSEPFVAAATERAPGADVRQAAAEELPWGDDRFDAALSQLVVNFMRDADAGVSEMRRVARPGGVVAACTWSYGEDMEMLRGFWDAARRLDSGAPDEGSTMRYRSAEELEELWQRVGLDDVDTDHLRVETGYTGFDDLWEPFTYGVGPAGAYLAKLDSGQREQLRTELFKGLGEPAGQFTLSATACAVRGEA